MTKNSDEKKNKEFIELEEKYDKLKKSSKQSDSLMTKKLTAIEKQLAIEKEKTINYESRINEYKQSK